MESLIQEAPDETLSPSEIALSGFVKTKDGWRRIHPDLRDKVNVRCAELQADGTYYVADVDIFKPNKAKGESGEYEVSDCLEAMKNTLAMIEAGGQMPSITLEHPSPLAKANDIAKPSYGCAVNFRESPRGAGWVRCDFKEIPANVMADWKAKKYTGMSAGLVADKRELKDKSGNYLKDANGNTLFAPTNLRFGHVALLGGESQAISDLPMTQIFSACEGTDTVCFSAEPLSNFTSTVSVGTIPAEAGNKQTSSPLNLMSIEQLTADLNAAFSAKDYEKVRICQTQLDGLVSANFAAEKIAGIAKDGSADVDTVEPGDNDEVVDDSGDLDLPDASDFGAEPGDEFSAERFAALESEVTRLRAESAQNKAMKLAGMFAAEVDGLIAKGHQIDKGAAMDMFSALLPSPEGMAAYRASLKKAPIARASARGAQFSATATGETGAIVTGEFSANSDDFSAGVAEMARQGVRVSAADIAKTASCFVKTR
jgi:hypothetical protein